MKAVAPQVPSIGKVWVVVLFGTTVLTAHAYDSGSWAEKAATKVASILPPNTLEYRDNCYIVELT